MNLIQYGELACPYCGEAIEIAVDTSLPEQSYIEDCCVCCQPINLQLICEPGELLAINARRDDEA